MIIRYLAKDLSPLAGDKMHFIRFFKGEGNNAMGGQSYRQFEFVDKTVWPDIRQLDQYKIGIQSN